RPLPARALEELVAERITAETADVKLVQHIERSLRARIEAQRASLAAIRADLPGRVASASAAASKLADELGKLDGRARELVEAKLRVEADRLVAAERQLAETERDLADLEVADAEATWMLGALRDFANVWTLMTPENRGRLLRALVASVRVNDATGEVEIELVNFSADARAEGAAAWRSPRPRRPRRRTTATSSRARYSGIAARAFISATAHRRRSPSPSGAPPRSPACSPSRITCRTRSTAASWPTAPPWRASSGSRERASPNCSICSCSRPTSKKPSWRWRRSTAWSRWPSGRCGRSRTRGLGRSSGWRSRAALNGDEAASLEGPGALV